MNKYSTGICIGASTISIVESQMTDNKIEIKNILNFVHEGSPKKYLSDYLNNFDNVNSYLTITGRKFRHLVNAHSVPEPEAIEEAFKYLGFAGKYGAIASLGGENFLVYCMNQNGEISNIISGNKCASGTGEFFLQQIGRMGLSLEEASNITNTDKVYHVSGRCSVFCKSDCTHALNKGVNKDSVVSGLSKMIADKIIELLSKQKSKNVLIIGGVSQNKTVIKFLKEEYPNIFIPEEATYFEALGSSLIGFRKKSGLNKDNIFLEYHSAFPTLPPLKQSSDKVVFKSFEKGIAKENDVCIIGLDIGSTTTKSVLLRVEDNSVLASVYLRTNGNPIQATIDCLKSLKNQINVTVKIIGIGTTGSGRHIAALFTLTKGVVNEIIAHAVAAAYFDKDVDTILEIGGQDAKYTYLTNGIASDYAMNEACSAGTGSFLEEAAKESLNIYYKDIADIAFKSQRPINFNDQCAAFISSDIKNASHEGIPKEDIVAGLIYSVCMNYNNRVKGNRKVGKKVFMQGGVCYNKAVPYAMAHLIGKEIIVPPEPGLMGAFGVALEIKNRILNKQLEEEKFDFDTLINRNFKYKSEFICAGGSDKCDRKCSISIIEVDNKKYPFGGACNKYYNLRNKFNINPENFDYVKKRQELVFNKYLKFKNPDNAPSIGILKSFMTNTLYPLYYNFFTQLGFKVVLSDKIEAEGIDKIRSSFCYPVEIAHGLFQNLINKKVDYIFLPHITQMPKTDFEHNKLCVFAQAEKYYLTSAFEGDELPEIIAPIIDFSSPYSFIEKSFLEIATQLNVSKKLAKKALKIAYDILNEMYSEFKEIGKKVLDEINQKEEFAVVLFGRAYNSFSNEANLNIPHKFASKGVTIIPHDFLPSDNLPAFENMYWASGQQIIRSARYIKDNDKLFGVFITNFSCGPDSFIIPYFRKIMDKKPSLTLELDSHSADVGIDTRIDAALDIFHNYLELKKIGITLETREEEGYLRFYTNKKEFGILDADNNKIPLSSEKVEVLIPSMGRFSTEAFSAVFRSVGINSRPLPVPTFNTLQHGRTVASCKECLPFLLTTGSLIEHTLNIPKDKYALFFMPYGHGPCRQGQYFIMMKEIIKEFGLKNVGVLSMNEEEAFDDLGNEFFRRGFIAVLIADIVTDIYSAIELLALDKDEAIKIFEKEWANIISIIETGDENEIFRELEKFSDKLKNIKLKYPLSEAKVISLVGEIYVRREEFSRAPLFETLKENGFLVKTAPISEYVYYSNYLLLKRNHGNQISFKEKVKATLKNIIQLKLEKKIKTIFAKSGLYNFEMINIDETINYGNKLISEELAGESILTVGLSLREILTDSCGVISIGPFNCMPSRLSEAILNKEMTLAGKIKNSPTELKLNIFNIDHLPFLYVETDGNSLPQLTQSKLEIFMMQANKLYNEMQKAKKLITQ